VPWCGRLNVTIIPFAEIQEEIRRNCPEDHFTLIMRRFMMRLADALAKDLNCRALVTGESLGQVSSQTLTISQRVFSSCIGPPRVRT
jgi:thiamine biosynthesis protein ThiI